MYSGYVIIANRFSDLFGFILNMALGTNSPVNMIINVDIIVSSNREFASLKPLSYVVLSSSAMSIPYMTRTILLPTSKLEMKLLLLV